jgi:amino acid adenylation domain-containing protein
MNDVYDLLKELKKLEARIYTLNGKIKLDIKAGLLTDEISEKIKYYREDILALLGEVSKEEFTHIEKINEQVSYPISDAQRRLWILSQFEKGSVAYNMPNSVYLNQDIDIDCFKRAVDSTIERHESLRTLFKEDNTGEVRQWILKREDLNFKIEYRDFRKEKDKDKKVKEYIVEEQYKIFDLVNGPLLKASLLQVEDKAYIFYYNMHHIICDGWSMEILTRDLFSYYEAYKNGEKPLLKELRIQYKDYSAWQLAQLKDESFKKHKAFWLENLNGKLPLLTLPGLKPRPIVKTNNGHGLSTYIDDVTGAKLKKYSQENGGSLFMGLLAVWNILLYRYTSQTCIIIGTPVAGREHADLEDQIGFYINTLALRNELSPEDSFHDFYKTVKDNTLKSFSHQIYPFDRLVDDLNLQGDTSRNAIFDLLLALQNNGETAADKIKLGKEELNHISDLGYIPTTFDLRINVQEFGDYLSMEMVYNPDVYEREMVEGLMRHYKQLLNALLENPEEKISQIDYLSSEEQQELLVTFNTTLIAHPKNKTVIELFGEQVAKNPANAALVFAERKLSYSELDESSNKLARYLKEKYSIGAEDLVGIQLQKSDWLVISILAVLKAGGAYVPIDPEYPSLRKEYIVKDASLKLMITEADFIHDIDYYEGEVFAIDIELGGLNCSSESLNETPLPNHLVYTIYTSGSTGQPKGVMVEHAALANLCFWHKNRFSVSEKDRATLYAGQAFDASVWELFPYLISGACLYIIPQKMRLDSVELNSYFETNHITIAFLPTPVATQFMEVENKSLRYLLTGGEKLNYFQKKNYRLVNNYGPTESTVVTTSVEIGHQYSNIPIGQPIDNIQVYIINEKTQLQPKGVSGEICISGAGLARGYLNQEALTKEKFIRNPFKEGEYFYKTGDLGKWLSDGTIAITGRRDDQVKVRGHRIEPGEIEQTLLKHEHIKEAVVLARENRSNEKELVVYFSAKSELDQLHLKEYLRQMLPEYMVPAFYLQLEVLPLTANGKIDRRSLSEENSGMKNEVPYVAPRNEIEKKLLKIWVEVLKQDNIGVKHDFFALGGHSLKIIKVINQVNKQFGLKYDLKGVYGEPTIEAMALRIKTDIWFLESKIENENDYNEVKI